MNYRNLTPKEIQTLENQGCWSPKWDQVKVSDDFNTNTIWNSTFTGSVQLGRFDATVPSPSGVDKKAGIFHSSLHNTTVEDNARISLVHSLSGYVVKTKAVLENVGLLAVTEETTFGNGVEIDPVNEGGGRTVPIFDRLSSQLAYMIAMYRDDEAFSSTLLKLVEKYVRQKKSDTGIIGSGACIYNTQTIKNVSVGEKAVIQGASLLEEGTIASSGYDPAFVGDSVIMKEFIMLSGSKVEGGALLDRCFVGQGVKIGKQYSAENSCFFANAEGFHGEACSIFAGPYAVTHHKSTLLIAALLSFYNAGSGTNQSNHMYKLGPLHQGILERGSKTGSFSYLLWPCRIGAFSVITGKHYVNCDTSEFPFSYITEEDGESMLTPAMNLFTVGTKRDSEKWPKRDRRKDPDKLDLLHFDLFSPYVISRVVRGIDVLTELSQNTPKTQDIVRYKGIKIKRILLRTCAKYYKISLAIYLGEQLIKRLEKADEIGGVKKALAAQIIEDEWIDMAGMFLTRSDLTSLQKKVTGNEVDSVETLQKTLQQLYKSYEEKTWNWTAGLIKKMYGDEPSALSSEQLTTIIEEWKKASVKLNNMIMKDAEKEFDPTSMLGFGIDGDEETQKKDFTAVRGTYEENSFVKGLIEDSRLKEEKASKIIGKL